MTGLELRARREKFGVSQKDLAGRIGAGEDEIREWERTGYVPRKQRFAVKAALWETERDRIMSACEVPVCEWILERDAEQWSETRPEQIAGHLAGCSLCKARQEYAQRHVPPAPLGGGIFRTTLALLDRLPGWRRSAATGSLVVLAIGGIGVPFLLLTGVIRGDLTRILCAFALLLVLLASGAAGGIVHYLTAPLRQHGRIGHYTGWILTVYGYLAAALGFLFLGATALGPRWGDSRTVEMLSDPLGVIIFLAVGTLFGLVVGHIDRASAASASRPERTPGSTFQTVLTAVAALLMLAAGLMNRLGDGARAEEDWQQALPGLEEAVRSNPNDPEAHLSLAYALLELNRRSDALRVLERTVELAPDNADARNSLGWTLNQFERFADAVPVLQEAVRLEPDHPYAHHNLGWALANLRRFEEAERSYAEAVRVDPNEAGARSEYAWLLIELRKLDAAAEQVREAIRLQPNNPDHHRGLATALMQNGKPKEALDAYRNAATHDPENPVIWSEIGRLAHLGGEYEISDAAFRRVSELHPAFFDDNEVALRMWQASKEKRQYVP